MYRLLLMISVLSFLFSCDREDKIDSFDPGTYSISLKTDSTVLTGLFEFTRAKDDALVGRVKMDWGKYNHGPITKLEISADSIHSEFFRYKMKLSLDSLSGVLEGRDIQAKIKLLKTSENVSAVVEQSMGLLPLKTSSGAYLEGRWPTPIDDSSFYYVTNSGENPPRKQVRIAELTADGWVSNNLKYNNDLYAIHSIGISRDKSYLIAHANTLLEQDDPDYQAGLFKVMLETVEKVASIEYLPASINDSDLGLIIFPSLDDEGVIYFAANAPNLTLGKMDIFKAVPKGTDYEVIKLGPPVSSQLSDAAPYVTITKGIMLFYRRTESGEYPATDKIFLSRKVENNWQDPVKLGPPINTPYAFEYGARLSDNMKYLYLTSHRRGKGHIYRINKEDFPELKSLF